MARKKKRISNKLDEFVDALPEGFRDTWDKMPEDVKDYFVKAADESRTSAEFVARIMVGSCPQCGSIDTASGEDVENIEDPTVGMCKACGFLWCLECELPLTAGSECLHWQVCRDCDVPKNEYGDCEKLPSECGPMKEWLARNPVQYPEITCSWCKRAIPEDQEHFMLGAKVLKSRLLPTRAGVVELSIAAKKKKIHAIVPAENSTAKKEGKDVLFVVCCEDCAQALSQVLKESGGDFEIIL